MAARKGVLNEMKIIHETEFNELMKKEGLVLVDFFATWCGPCKMLAPVLEETALAAQFRIMSVPTMILFRNGEAIQKISGFQPKPQLVSFLKQFI